MTSYFSWPYVLFLLCSVGAVLIHELGHVATASVLGVKIKRIGLAWRGLYIVREPGSHTQNLLITLAGPLSNLLTMAACVSLSHVLHIRMFWAWMFASSQAVFLMNILPLPSSDGLRAVKLVRTMASSFRQTVSASI